jgi:hypothetical protein
MKKSIKILVAAIALLISASAHAQISVGAGYLNTSLMDKAGAVSENTNFNGFYIEGDYQISLMDDFLSVVPGVRYSMGSTNFQGVKWSEQYIDIPVMFDLGYSFSDRFRLFAFTGPELSLGLSSKMKLDGVSISMYDVNQEEYFGDGKYRRFDILWGYGVGVDLLGFLRIKASCDSGLLDRVNTSDKTTTHRNLFRLGVAVVF